MDGILVQSGKKKGYLVGRRNWYNGRFSYCRNNLNAIPLIDLSNDEYLLLMETLTNLRKLSEMMKNNKHIKIKDNG